MNGHGGVGTFSEVGGLRSKIIKCMPILCKVHMLAGMQSIPNLGGSGGMPPRKFCKFTLSEIESENISGP